MGLRPRLQHCGELEFGAIDCSLRLSVRDSIAREGGWLFCRSCSLSAATRSLFPEFRIGERNAVQDGQPDRLLLERRQPSHDKILSIFLSGQLESSQNDGIGRVHDADLRDEIDKRRLSPGIAVSDFAPEDLRAIIPDVPGFRILSFE